MILYINLKIDRIMLMLDQTLVVKLKDCVVVKVVITHNIVLRLLIPSATKT